MGPTVTDNDVGEAVESADGVCSASWSPSSRKPHTSTQTRTTDLIKAVLD